MTAAGDPIAFLIPGDLDTPTGGYAYARALIESGPRQGLYLTPTALPDDFPSPSADSLTRSATVMAGLAAGRPALVDGLAFGALPGAVLDMARGPLVVLLHHPLGLETGLDPATAARLVATETAALAHAAAIIVPSAHIAATLRERFAVPSARITVAPPGTRAMPAAARAGDPPIILSTGTITARKGHDVLVAALAGLRAVPWSARFIGSTARDPATADRLRQQIAEVGLTDRITLSGAVTDAEMAASYGAADLFALASHYEGYGMVFAEALAAGLPIVATRGGAVPDLVPVDAGLLVAPGDVAALRAALALVLSDRNRADAMAGVARAAGARLPQWAETMALVAAVLDRAGS